MAVAPARDGRRENWTSILQEISHLFLQVDLHGSFRAQQHSCAEEYCEPENNPHTAFKLAGWAKVARLHGDWCFDRRVRVVADEFEIFELEVVYVFYGRI